ncbi:hypothetical protein [Aliiroseovarius sp. YM-037]|uniref:hypothetical protein n=1 Tax=Aliiroseovarius sp. YM-037 TaxID=3341728 RepID=UPI003A801EC0
MAIGKEHEIHKRRSGRNTGVGIALAAFVAIIFGLTVVKVKVIDVGSAYDESTGVALE